MFAGLKNKKIAIIGQGYLGKALKALLHELRSGIDFEFDTIDRKSLPALGGKTFDVVFNCAGNTGDFRANPWETVTSNLEVTRFLMQEVNISESLVLLSSTRVYGFSADATKVFSENDICVPYQDHLGVDFIYDGSKMLMESAALNGISNGNPRVVICRLSNVFGRFGADDMDDATFLKKMIRCKMQNEGIMIDQNNQSAKDYIFIDDAVRGILTAGVSAGKSGIFNIASGKSVTLQQWVDFLKLDAVFVNQEKLPLLISNISVEKARQELQFAANYGLGNLSMKNIYTT